MSSQIIFLCDDRLTTLCDGMVINLTSQREQKYLEALRELEHKYEWKTSGMGAQFMHQNNSYAGRAEHAACSITSIAGQNGSMVYSIVTEETGGIYIKDPTDDEAPEQYRFGQRGFGVADIDVKPGAIACAVEDIRGEQHIAMLDDNRAGYRWITSGDTVDSAPWFSADGNKLYYASVGIARDERNMIIAFGPSSVLCLDLKNGNLDEICEDNQKDFIRPKQGPDGRLYMIVRPYKLPEPPRRTVGDRLRGVGDFFRGLSNIVKIFGSTANGKETQPTASGGAAVQTRMLNGRRVEISTPAEGEEEKGCAPNDWVLMRMESDGSFTEIQKGVADFAFDGDALVYTDGRRIFRCKDGKREKLYKGGFIPRIAIVK